LEREEYEHIERGCKRNPRAVVEFGHTDRGNNLSDPDGPKQAPETIMSARVENGADNGIPPGRTRRNADVPRISVQMQSMREIQENQDVSGEIKGIEIDRFKSRK